ncbi:MAG TPA: glucose-6-phosphate dehydrogenase assembly protein OpcA [Actinopolymorphaceae bacterium]
MKVEVENTTASKISSALVEARRAAGSPAMGMVLTLVVIADEENADEAMIAAGEASKEHPSRILGVILHGGRGAARLDATIAVGEGLSGEAVLMRMYGELAKHAESVVTPLLLPESPVVVWWPQRAPARPAEDPIGRLAQRRVTDAGATKRPLTALRRVCDGYAPGDTDLAWTRTTHWRALLAAALDQHPAKVERAVVEADRSNASAQLIAAWLRKRLRIETKLVTSDGPGITACRLQTPDGDISITRPDGVLARYSIPGQPERTVALKRRETHELLAEELRRLDPDDVYAEAVRALVSDRSRGKNGKANKKSHTMQKRSTARKAAR